MANIAIKTISKAKFVIFSITKKILNLMLVEVSCV